MNLVTEAIKNEFEGRCRKNPQYSLRAFARFLELDPPTLSRILNNKKEPGIRLAQRLLDKIALPPSKQRLLLRSYSALGNLNESDSAAFKVVQNDQFQLTANWYYNAMLEILELEDFDSSPRWIAARLGLSLSETKIALERLERLGFLEKHGESWRDASGGKTTTISKELTSGARRENQKQVLQKAMDCLEAVDTEKRDQSSMTFAIDTNDIPKVKELIKEFRRKISKFGKRSNKSCCQIG